MKKAFRYRLYPKPIQKEKIDQTLETCRILYNTFLAERKEAYEQEKRKITCFEQINSLPSRKEINPFLAEVFSQILQDIARRVHKSFQNFLRRVGKVGYPRFKGKFRYDSFTYPQHGFKLVSQKQIYFSQLGSINIRKHRETEGTIKTCSILVKNSKYYAVFSCEVEPKPLPKTGKKIGIDLGLTSFLATSDGDLKKVPKTYKKAGKQLGELQRIVAKLKKGSKRSRKAVRILAVKHEKVANQRKDLAHKLAKELVEKYDLIAHEKLQIRNMVKNRYLAKSINDSGWNLFLTILSYKVAETGKQIVEVDPRNTSQICSNCDEPRKQKLKLSQRKFNCSQCDYKDNRDINAARNILKRAEWAGSTLQGSVPIGTVKNWESPTSN